MLDLVVQPPTQTRPGEPLYPPIAAALSSDTSIYKELSQTWAIATLVHQSGELLQDHLGGRVADSAHPLPESGYGQYHSRGHSGSSTNSKKSRAYFYFPGLTIQEPGQYRIRVSLMQMDYSHEFSPDGAAKVCEYVESRSIIVEDRVNNHTRPSKQIQGKWKHND
jgi:hypothetical protein